MTKLLDFRQRPKYSNLKQIDLVIGNVPYIFNNKGQTPELKILPKSMETLVSMLNVA